MNPIKTTLLLASALAFTGCATLENEGTRVEVASSEQVRITNVRAHRDDGLLHVSAQLRPVSAAVTRVGHVDVEFFDARGETLRTIKAEPNTGVFSRDSARQPAISVKAAFAAGAVSEIRLSNHVDTFEECEN